MVLEEVLSDGSLSAARALSARNLSNSEKERIGKEGGKERKGGREGEKEREGEGISNSRLINY